MEVKYDIYVDINDFYFFLCINKINVNMNVFWVFFFFNIGYDIKIK